MSEEQNGSRIAQLMTQIDQEHAACVWALEGLSSGTSQHEYIARRMRHMDKSYKGLENIIGEEKATDYLCEVFNRTPNRLTACDKQIKKGVE